MISGATAVNTRVLFFNTPAHTRLRVHWAPGIPARPLIEEGGKLRTKLGRNPPRECEGVHPVFSMRPNGLLGGACHQAREPLARNDKRSFCCLTIESVFARTMALPRGDDLSDYSALLTSLMRGSVASVRLR